MPALPLDVDDLIRRALAEDLGPEGDVTSRVSIPDGLEAAARIEARAPGILAGVPIAGRVFAAVDPAVAFDAERADGDAVEPGDVVAGIRGPARSVLAAERVALNLLTHLSGIATATRQYVDACAGTESRILCTRKTLPGLRSVERYAVECGGGLLHRAGLHDGVLLKDNHLAVG